MRIAFVLVLLLILAGCERTEGDVKRNTNFEGGGAVTLVKALTVAPAYGDWVIVKVEHPKGTIKQFLWYRSGKESVMARWD